MSDPERRARANRMVALFFGWLLLVVGVLVAGLSGLCIAAFAGGSSEMAGIAWTVGALPLLFGLVMFAAGVGILVMQRRRPGPARADLATFSDPPPPTEPPHE